MPSPKTELQGGAAPPIFLAVFFVFSSQKIGSIRTLTLDAKLRLVPNDDRANDKAPAFRVLLGHARVGDAWEMRTTGDTSKTWLRLRLDDPTFPDPLNLALFPFDTGDKAALVWNRKKEG